MRYLCLICYDEQKLQASSLGGVVLIEAGDLDDAIRVAAKIPPARLGCVEVRPIQELAPQ
jgi:hypothetical protein